MLDVTRRLRQKMTGSLCHSVSDQGPVRARDSSARTSLHFRRPKPGAPNSVETHVIRDHFTAFKMYISAYKTQG